MREEWTILLITGPLFSKKIDFWWMVAAGEYWR
jgi:hypothetical protein